jgi:hypothetical protein
MDLAKSAKIGNLEKKSKMETKMEAKVKGVHKLKNGRFKATITAMNEFVYLGCFDTYEEAAKTRLKAEEVVKKKFPGWRPGVHPMNTSGVVGISYSKRDRKWQARKNGQYLGTFDRLRDAEKAIADFVARGEK